MEKTSISVAACAEFLRERDRYLIMSHCRPDGDTLGSSGALCLILRKMGKAAYLMPNPEITPRFEAYVGGLIAPADYVHDTLVAVDLAAETMFPRGFAGGEVALCIDHHGSNSFYAGQTLVHPECAACGEIILELARELGTELDGEIADLLYIAISTDTGCFLYRNTTPATHRAAAAVMEAGADYGRINKLMFRTISEARMRLEGAVYAGLKRYQNGEINAATITLEMMERFSVTENDCDDLAAIAGRIEGSLCSITVREIAPGKCKISLRSGDQVDASAVCAQYGGGGHPMAAGCSLDCPPEEAREKIVRAVMGAWKR
jgi:phosphoesterase RecJ-like protein